MRSELKYTFWYSAKQGDGAGSWDQEFFSIISITRRSKSKDDDIRI